MTLKQYENLKIGEEVFFPFIWDHYPATVYVVRKGTVCRKQNGKLWFKEYKYSGQNFGHSFRICNKDESKEQEIVNQFNRALDAEDL